MTLAHTIIPADQLAAALRGKAEALQAQLRARVDADLSGLVLRERSGALKASVFADLDADANGVRVALGSAGVPYAAIQEYGGTTPAHRIEPVKARALALAGRVFAGVDHPGSRIPARAPFGRALDALRDEIAGGLKDAVRDALGAG